MSKISEIVKAQASDTVKALNPHVFGVFPVEMTMTNEERVELSKHPISQPGAIKPHFMRPSTDEAKLNKTEKEYLNILRSNGNHWVGIQCMTFKLGDDCRYTPDFMTLTASGEMYAYEVKGFMRDDALVKLKTACRMYRFIQFFLVKKLKAGWDKRTVNP